MSSRDLVAIVHAFWDAVGNAHDQAAADGFAVDDYAIVSGGAAIQGKENFKKWITEFLAVVDTCT